MWSHKGLGTSRPGFRAGRPAPLGCCCREHTIDLLLSAREREAGSGIMRAAWMAIRKSVVGLGGVGGVL